MVIQSCTPWNKIHFVFLTLIPSLKPVNHTDVKCIRYTSEYSLASNENRYTFWLWRTSVWRRLKEEFQKSMINAENTCSPRTPAISWEIIISIIKLV